MGGEEGVGLEDFFFFDFFPEYPAPPLPMGLTQSAPMSLASRITTKPVGFTMRMVI